MASQPKIEKHHGLDRETMLKIYRLMYMSRWIDDKELELEAQAASKYQARGTKAYWSWTLVDQHQSGARDHSAALWMLSMMESFLRQVDGASADIAAMLENAESTA